MNFARLLSLPFVVLAIIVSYRIFTRDLVYESIYVAAAVVAVVVIFVLSPQINWFFWKFFPPKLNPKLIAIAHMCWPELEHFPAPLREKLYRRIILYTRGIDIKFVGDDTAPEDIMVSLATIPVRMTTQLEGEAYLMQPYEKILFYTKLFPTPDMLWPHASETHHEDKVMILSAKTMLDAFRDPKVNFQVALYEFAGIFKILYPNLPWPNIGSEEDWKKLEKISLFNRALLDNNYGLKTPDIHAFAITLYFISPNEFKRELPDLFLIYSNIFSISF